MKRRAKQQLPVELWMIILDMVLSSYVSYEDCISINFPQFLCRWRNQEFDVNEGWKQLRLVCRTWSTILGKRGPQEIRVKSYDDLINATNVRSLVVDANVSWPYQKSKQYPLDRRLHRVTKNITSISLFGIGPQSHEPFIDFLMKHARYFQNLKTLSLASLDVTRHLGQQFWSALEKNFPELLSLRITGFWYEADGNITLPKLKILEIGIMYPPRCLFPSLEHLSIGVPPEGQYIQFISQHAPSLKSIIIPGHYGSDEGKTDLGDFPKLELFGGTKDTLIRAQLPANHPLRHIYITDSSNYSGLTIPKIMARYSSLRYLTFDFQPVCSLTMWSVRRICKQNKVTYMDVASDRRMKTFFHRWIEILWKHVVYFINRTLHLLALQVMMIWMRVMGEHKWRERLETMRVLEVNGENPWFKG